MNKKQLFAKKNEKRKKCERNVKEIFLRCERKVKEIFLECERFVKVFFLDSLLFQINFVVQKLNG